MAASRLDQSENNIDECRLAATRRADYGDRLARLDLEIESIEQKGLELAVTKTQVDAFNTAGQRACAFQPPRLVVVLGRRQNDVGQTLDLRAEHPQLDEVVDKLFRMGIIGEKNSNQPRKVLSVCLEKLIPETLAFMEKYGYTVERISECFSLKGDVTHLNRS